MRNPIDFAQKKRLEKELAKKEKEENEKHAHKVACLCVSLYICVFVSMCIAKKNVRTSEVRP